MVLEHVLQCPGAVEVAGAPFEREGLLPQNLDLVDGLAVPESFDDRNVAAHLNEALYRSQAEHVVDAIPIQTRPSEQPVERAGALEVVAERLLENDAAAGSEVKRAERFDRGGEHSGREGQVGSNRLPYPADRPGEARRISEVDGAVGEHARREDATREAAHPVLVEVTPRSADDAKVVGKPAGSIKGAERRKDVAAREVAGRAEKQQCLDHPANSRAGRPRMPTSARKTDPASGSSRGARFSRDVVM